MRIVIAIGGTVGLAGGSLMTSLICLLGLEDKATACQMLVCYARELKEHFVDYTEQTVKLMVPMLKFYFHDGVRTAASESIPCLLECAKIRGPNYVQEMWSYICPEMLKVRILNN